MLLGVLLLFTAAIYKTICRIFQVSKSSARAALKVFFVFLWLFAFVFLFFQHELFGRTSPDSYQILFLASAAMAGIVGVFTYWILEILLTDD